MSTAASVSWKGAWHPHILVCAGFCPHFISYSKDVELWHDHSCQYIWTTGHVGLVPCIRLLQINCTTYDSFVHMGCHILSTVPLDSISWATSSALLDGEPNKLHNIVGFFWTYRLSHFVNDLLTFQIMNHSICLTGWKAKYTAPLMILLYTWVVTFCQRFAYFPDYEPLHLPYWMESQINCTTYDSFVHMGCHILSTVPLDSISWATPSALRDRKPNKLHHLWFFCTHGLSHFVNSSIRFHILSHFICLTGWRAK